MLAVHSCVFFDLKLFNYVHSCVFCDLKLFNYVHSCVFRDLKLFNYVHSCVFCDLKMFNYVILAAISYSVSEKNIHYVWNSNVQHLGHKNPSVGRILSHRTINVWISQVLSAIEVLRPNSFIRFLSLPCVSGG